MNHEIVFRLLLFILLAVFVVHRGYYTKKYGRPESDALRSRPKTAAQMMTNGLNLLALAATAVYLVVPGWLEWASLSFPTWWRWAGVVVALTGFALLHWAHQALNRNWSDTPRLLSDQVLVVDGPYRRVRHPIYSAFLLILSTPLFLSANWFVGGLWIVSTALEVVSRVRYEEALLADQYRERYRDYSANTGRLAPRLFSTREK